MLLVYRYRIKSLTGLLSRQARACNFVWNFCNDTQQQALKWNKRWPSGFDLNRLTAGSSKELALHAGTIGRGTGPSCAGAAGALWGGCP
jgi:putative transposase